MKVWIDILTPKQVMFFGKLIEKLQNENYELLLTTRDYAETNRMLEFKGIKAEVVGKHGGKSLDEKLEASIRRMKGLKDIVAGKKIDAGVSLSSPELSRVAFGLKIPHICVNDIPEAEAVAKLTVPLATKIVTPKLIPKSIWAKYGVSEKRIIQYDALDPVAWLKDFQPDKKVLELLGIEEGKPIITFRAEEAFASYLEGKADEKNSVIMPIANELMEKIDGNFVVLPRYAEQRKSIQDTLNGSAFIPDFAVDGTSLLAYSDVFIGSGGTMTVESALLGTPTISCRQIDTLYDKYVVNKNLAFKINNAEEVVSKTVDIVKNNHAYKKELQEKAEKLMRTMENPIDVVFNAIKEFA